MSIFDAGNVLIDASGPRTLTSNDGDTDIAFNVNQITLDGGSSLVTIDANGMGDAGVILAPVNTINPVLAPSLTITADGSAGIDTIDLNGTTDGVLNITVDEDDDTFEFLNMTGQVTNVAMLTLSGGLTQDGSHDDLIDVDADLNTTAGPLTIQNAEFVTLGADVDLTSMGGDVSVSTNIGNGPGGIDLDGPGPGSNIIDANGGSVSLANVTDSSDVIELEIEADDNVTLGTILLDDPAPGTAGLLDINVDFDDDGGAFAAGALEAGIITINSNSDLTITDVVRATQDGTGSISISADENAVPGSENLTLSAGAIVEVTGAGAGTIDLSAGDDFTLESMAFVGDGGQDDVITISGDAGSMDAAGSTINISGTIIGETLLIQGNSGDDVLQIVESGVDALPSLDGDATALAVNPGHTNAAYVNNLGVNIPAGFTNIGTHFEAMAGNDSIEFTYANTYTVSYFSDDDARDAGGAPMLDANSGVVNVGTQMTLSFDGLAPISHTSLAGGTLVTDASATPATNLLTINDSGGPDGENIVTGNMGFEDTTFSGFDNLIVRGGTGTETITLVTVDAADPDLLPGGPAPLSNILIDGDDSFGAGAVGTDTAPDIINVQALPDLAPPVAPILPAGIALQLNGGDAANATDPDDTFNIDSNLGTNDDGGTVNTILDSIDVNGEIGVDMLNIDDSGDATDNTMNMDATTIGGDADLTFGGAVIPGGIFGATGILTYDATTEQIDIDAGPTGGGINQFFIQATGVGGAAGDAEVTIDDGAGDSFWVIQGNALAATGDHEFNGNDGNDAFELRIADGTSVTGSEFHINGGAPASTLNTDSVVINDGVNTRDITMTYVTPNNDGDVDIEGLGVLLDINTTETGGLQRRRHEQRRSRADQCDDDRRRRDGCARPLGSKHAGPGG